MTRESQEELLEALDTLEEAYNTVKQEIRCNFPILYERWKAGGFLIDDNIVSMYPAIGEIREVVEEEEVENEEEEEEEEEERVVCEHCGSLNTNNLEEGCMECYDCGKTYLELT